MQRRLSPATVTALLILLALCSPSAAGEEQMCVVEGTYTNPQGLSSVDGLEVLCHHSGGTYTTRTDTSLPYGNYRCEVDPGPVEIEAQECPGKPGTIYLGSCPDECDGVPGETVTCNIGIVACGDPCLTAFLALPPLALRRRRHARAALDGPTGPA